MVAQPSPVSPAETGDVPPKSRRAPALPPEQRRDAIIEATLPLLLEHGPGVTTRQIAEAAGIAEGTIFRIFPDKDALLDAVIERAMDPTVVEARLMGVDLDLPLEARLVEAVQIIQDRVLRIWQLMSIVGFRPHKHGDSRMRPGRPPFADPHGLTALLEPDRDQLRFDPATTARRLRGFILATGHPAFVGDDRLDPADVVSLFLDGARRRPAEPQDHPC